MQSQLVSAHGMLAILEVLESRTSRDVTLRLLQIINAVRTFHCVHRFCPSNEAIAGYGRHGLPRELLSYWWYPCHHGCVVSTLGASTFCSPACRLHIEEVPVRVPFGSFALHPSAVPFVGLDAADVHLVRTIAAFKQLVLTSFCSTPYRCRGLKVLVDLLDEDYTEQSQLVVHALNGICSVFELQSPTTKNDFCRMFIREGLLDPLSSALLNVMASRGEAGADMNKKIIQIILVFCQVSQSDIHVRNALGTRKIVRREQCSVIAFFDFTLIIPQGF